MQETTDSFLDLVGRAQGGDPLAFDRLVRRFQDMAFGYALSLSPDRGAAEDAAQEAFVEAYRLLPALREPAAFPGWLRRLVFKHCDRAGRGGQRRRERAALPLEAARAEPDLTADPLAGAVRRQEAARVRAAVRGLPDGEREAVGLFYFGGCAAREIAAFLEVPEATVRTRLHRARRRLLAELRKETGIMGTDADVERAAAGAAGARPSEGGRLADRVLAEIAEEYRRQRREDPEGADRSLLAKARERIEGHLREGRPLALETVRVGQNLLAGMGEKDGRVALLRHFLTQPGLGVGEEAWA